MSSTQILPRQAAPGIDTGEFRKALGQFATGVTIVTTRGLDGGAVGVTVSSFNSLSLDPPLILWSLDKTAQSLAAFQGAEHFAVHVLTLEQEELALTFAKKGADKFAELALEAGLGGCPLLRECAARFHCQMRYRYEGGDHKIFVGEVKHFENFGRTPLIFHGGQFARLSAASGH